MAISPVTLAVTSYSFPALAVWSLEAEDSLLSLLHAILSIVQHKKVLYA